MIETTLDAALQSAAADVDGDAPAGAPPVADVQQFQAALDAGPELAPLMVEPPVKPAPAETPATLGARMLENIDEMRTAYSERMNAVGETIEPGPDGRISAADLMRLQMELMKVTFEEELLGKIVGKSTQNVDTLLKGQ